jgi:hypothetical protein
MQQNCSPTACIPRQWARLPRSKSPASCPAASHSHVEAYARAEPRPRNAMRYGVSNPATTGPDTPALSVCPQDSVLLRPVWPTQGCVASVVMDLCIRPHVGVGPIMFGASIRDTRRALAEPLRALGQWQPRVQRRDAVPQQLRRPGKYVLPRRHVSMGLPVVSLSFRERLRAQRLHRNVRKPLRSQRLDDGEWLPRLAVLRPR